MTTSAMMSPTSKHGVARVQPASGATREAVPSLNSGFSLSPQMVGAAALVGVMMKCMDSRNGDQELSKPHQNAKYENSQDWEEIPCLSQDDDLDNDDSTSQSSGCSSSARSPPTPSSTTKTTTTTKTSHPSPPKTIHKSLAAPSTAIDASDSSKIEITSLSSSPAPKRPSKATTRTSSIKTVRATQIAKIKRASVERTTSVGTATTVSSTTSGPPSPRMISSSLFSSLPKADAARGAPPPPPASPKAPIADASANKDNTDIVYDYYKQIESRVLPVVSSWFSPLSEEAAAPTQKDTPSSPKSARVSAATMLNLESRQRGRRMQQVVRGEEPKATFKIYCKNGSSNSNSDSNNHTDCYRIYCAAREATLRHAIAERLGMPDTLGIGTTSAIVIEYVDEDGDTCVLSSNEDVADAMRASQAAGEAVVKLTVTVPSLTEQLMGAWKQQTWW